MKVLIACEESQTACKAFRARGHEAFSCDMQECSGGHPEWHIRGEVIGKEKSPKHRSKSFDGIARAMAEQWG